MVEMFISNPTMFILMVAIICCIFGSLIKTCVYYITRCIQLSKVCKVDGMTAELFMLYLKTGENKVEIE